MALKNPNFTPLWSSCDELRGGMDASQYKDYVLVLLFIKYVSDKYAGVLYAPITIPEGASFKDMVALKGKSDIGDQINKKIIAPHPAREGTGRTLRNPTAASGKRCGRGGAGGEPTPGKDGILMELRPGQKQTEVGVVPEDWDVVLLDSVAKRGSGHTPDKKHPEYWGGDIKWVSLQDSDRLDRLYIYDTAAKITAEGIANSSATMHTAGTIVLSRDAGVGKSAIIRDNMAVSQHFMAWKCGPNLDNHFLYYWLQAKKSEFERIAMGNTIKTIGLPYFKQFVCPLPTKAEQEGIAEALSDADALIESLEQLIAKKRHLKQGVMQELLTGKRRLHGCDKTTIRYKQTEVGQIPEDWRVTWTTDGANAGTVFHRTGRFNCTNVCGTIRLKSDNAIFVSKVLAKIAPRHVSRNLGNPKLMNDVLKRIKLLSGCSSGGYVPLSSSAGFNFLAPWCTVTT